MTDDLLSRLQSLTPAVAEATPRAAPIARAHAKYWEVLVRLLQGDPTGGVRTDADVHAFARDLYLIKRCVADVRGDVERLRAAIAAVTASKSA